MVWHFRAGEVTQGDPEPGASAHRRILTYLSNRLRGGGIVHDPARVDRIPRVQAGLGGVQITPYGRDLHTELIFDVGDHAGGAGEVVHRDRVKIADLGERIEIADRHVGGLGNDFFDGGGVHDASLSGAVG